MRQQYFIILVHGCCLSQLLKCGTRSSSSWPSLLECLRAGLIIIFIWKVRGKRQNIGYLAEVKLRFLLNLGPTWKYFFALQTGYITSGESTSGTYPIGKVIGVYRIGNLGPEWTRCAVAKRKHNPPGIESWFSCRLGVASPLYWLSCPTHTFLVVSVRRRWPSCIVDTASNGTVTEYWLSKVVGKWDGKAWTGLIWLRIVTGGGCLWMQ
jgi:hypothetical protein